MGQEIGYSERLSCSSETKLLITSNCVDEFIKENPEFKGMNITHNMILSRIANYYLNRT